MSYLLEILGRGLLSELAAAFRDLLEDPKTVPTSVMQAEVHAHPERTSVHRDLGIRYLREQRYDPALRAFTDALATDDSDYVSQVGLACSLDSLGRTPEAVARLESAIQAFPSDAVLWFALGFCREKLSMIDGAIEAYEQSLDVWPELRNAHERLAAIYLYTGEPKPALAHYEHLSWCDPADWSVHLILAALYRRVGCHANAARQYEQAISLDSDRRESLDDLSTGFEDCACVDQAIERMESIIVEHPDGADYYVRLGNLLSQAGHPAQALTAYQKAATHDPNHLEAEVKIGSIQLSTGDYEEAAQAFSRAIEINDKLVDAYIGLGVSQQASGASREAMASFDAASLVEPNSDLLFAEVAKLQLRVSASTQRRHHLSPPHSPSRLSARDEATVEPLIARQMANLRAAITRHPTHADLHYRLGVLLRHHGDSDAAIRAFSDAVEINPHYIKALVKLGLTLRDAGDTPAAIGAFQRAIDLDKESIDLHYQLGLMFADEGEFAAALDRFEYATQHDPNNQDYVANLALALQNMGLLDRASATWQVLCDMTSEHEATATGPLSPLGSRFS